MEDEKYCIGCTTELNALDMHPNGDMPAKCVQCTAEENHDFDAEPRVRFNRAGHRMGKDGWGYFPAVKRSPV